MYGRKHGEGRVEEDGTTICERRGGRRETMAGCIVPGRWRTAQDLGLALDAIVQCLKKEGSERKSSAHNSPSGSCYQARRRREAKLSSVVRVR